MTLLELKQIIDSHIKRLPADKVEKINVVISLKEPSIGPRASVSVNSAYIGFDWEAEQFRIQAREDIARVHKTTNNTKDCVSYKCECGNESNFIVTKQIKYKIIFDSDGNFVVKGHPLETLVEVMCDECEGLSEDGVIYDKRTGNIVENEI